MNVLMFPHPSRIKDDTNGIAQVILNYAKYLPEYGVNLVEDGPADIVAVHAGMQDLPPSGPTVAMTHGLYWTGDRAGAKWEFEANANVVDSVRHAKTITVPSSWVGEAFQRDMHVSPYVIPHGVNWNEWSNKDDGGYVLWNKNRQTTTCDPKDVMFLAKEFTGITFVTTFGQTMSNVKVIGKQDFDVMRDLIQNCSVYLSTTKETGGIGIMEAMASGKPVLGYREGAIVDLVQHGVNGYLAESPRDLIQGLLYCVQNREVLGENSRELAREFTWQRSCEKLANVFQKTMEEEPAKTSIIIPCYNYGHLVGRAIESCIGQASEIIVVDDGSTDNTREVVSQYVGVKYIYQNNAGVAEARNTGIKNSTGKYVCCIDADDYIEPGFISVCVQALENDTSLGIAYTKLRLISRDGTKASRGASAWPDRFNYDNQVLGQNQVPTCCVFRKEAWKRLGGYRSRYAPRGCGSEDAELWLRMGSIGYNAKLVTEEPLFVYSYGGNTTGNSTYEEIDWRFWHPWTRNGQHPFASVATPENKSHLVHSYDTPLVSVIIPVGPGHEKHVLNSIDSVEAQGFKKWECIVVWDSQDTSLLEQYKANWPFVKWVQTKGGKGAGYSRNRGAEIARAPLIIFLDADDWFYPDMLEHTLTEYNTQGGDVAIYTDAVGKATLSKQTVNEAKTGKILFYDEQTQEAVIAKKNLPYECVRAQRQPDTSAMYLWCYISTLHPKAWFDEIGGFDEQMESWEDWDYWLRLARKGKCFIHLEQELMVYPYYTGSRRELGIKNFESLVSYMKQKYERIEKMPCRGCSGARTAPRPRMPIRQDSVSTEGTMDFEQDMVLANYTSTNRGDHKVIGHAAFTYRISGVRMVQTKRGYQIDYGYHPGGSRFIVHKDEFLAAPHLFQPVSSTVPEVHIASQRTSSMAVVEKHLEKPMPLKARQILEEELELDLKEEPVIVRKSDLQTVPGVSADIAAQLKELGADTLEDVLLLGVEGLKDIKGVGDKKADMIINAIEGMQK